MLDGDEYESLCCQCSEYQHQHAWGLWFAAPRTVLARQSPAVYVIVKLLSLHTTMFEAVYSCVLPLGILKGCNQVAVVSGFFRF